MIDELNKRIIELMVRTEHSKSSFAKAVDISLPIITHISTGRNKPGIELIQKIMIHFDTVSPEWLLLGKGEMFKKKSNSIDIQETINKLNTIKSELEILKQNHDTIIKYHRLLADEVKYLTELDQKLMKDDQRIDELTGRLGQMADELISKSKD